MLSFSVPYSIMAQNVRNANSGTIYVTKPRPKVASQAYKPQRDLYHNTMEVRLNLQHRVNLPLTQAILPKGWANGRKGIVMALIEGLRMGKFHGIHPDNPGRAYLYRDLAFDLLTLERLPTSQFSDEDIFKIVEKSVQKALDIVAVQGFSTQDSREFFKIRFLRLIWHNPNKSKLPHLLALIPYRSVRETLAKIMIKPHIRHHEATIRMSAFLETRRFFAHNLKHLSNNGLYILEPYMREAAIRESELWKY